MTAQQSSDQAKSGPFMSGISKSGIAEVRNRAGSTYSLVQSRSAAQDLSSMGLLAHGWRVRIPVEVVRACGALKAMTVGLCSCILSHTKDFAMVKNGLVPG